MTITASFAGDATYEPSSTASVGTVYAAPLIPTSITLSPSSFRLAPGDSQVLTAVLRDSGGNALAGKPIIWSATAGSLSAASTLTDNSGRASVVYTAPGVTAPTEVIIAASFPGDGTYAASSENSVAIVSPISTSLTITALSLVVESGGSLPLTALLLAENQPLGERMLEWSASLGTVTPASVLTDGSGRASAVYAAPVCENATPVTITVSFPGDNRHSAATATFSLTVLPYQTVRVLENLKENLQQAAAEFEAPPLQAENLLALENAFVRGSLGAAVTITLVAEKPGLSKGYEREGVRTRLGEVVVGERIEIVVESDENFKTVLINVGSEVLPVGWLTVLVDNNPIDLADDYLDVLDPTNDGGRPEYLILKGGKGAQILVSIPYFSARVITIRGPLAAPTRLTPALVAVGIVIVVVILLLAFRRRRSG